MVTHDKAHGQTGVNAGTGKEKEDSVRKTTWKRMTEPKEEIIIVSLGQEKERESK